MTPPAISALNPKLFFTVFKSDGWGEETHKKMNNCCEVQSSACFTTPPRNAALFTVTAPNSKAMLWNFKDGVRNTWPSFLPCLPMLKAAGK